MKKIPLAVLLTLISLHACKTTEIIQAERDEQPPAVAAFEIREFYMPADIPAGDDEVTRRKITMAVQQAAAEQCNSLFINTGELPAAGFDPLQYAVETAHKHDLRVFVIINLLKRDETGLTPVHELKKAIKEEVSACVKNYNIDGLCFRLPGYELPDTAISNTLIADMLEDAVAVAMLKKPYLLNTVLYTGGGKAGLIKEWKQQLSPREVVGLNFSEYFEGQAAGREIYLADEDRTKLTDSDGFIAFIAALDDTIRLGTSEGDIALSTWGWAVPYDYTVMPGNTVRRRAPWVEFRRMPDRFTGEPVYDLLCRTDYPAVVSINGQVVKQYKTGIFFKEIKLDKGANRIRATVIRPDSLSTFYEQEFFYEETDKTREPFPLWIDERSVEPSYKLELIPDDLIRISFMGSKAQEAYIRLRPGDITLRCSREDFEDYSHYRVDVPMNKLQAGLEYSYSMHLLPVSAISASDPYEMVAPAKIIVREAADFPLLRVINENSRLTYNLGAPRLGGPLRSEPGPGLVFKANGKFGDYYRVSLSRVEHGFLHGNDVELLPEGTVKPFYYITNMSCSPSAEADVLSIPYPEPVPWEIHPDPGGKRLIINLYGVGTSSTWISHYAGLKIIDRIRWEQVTPETYRVYVKLKTDRIWGYDLSVAGSRLVLRIKHPPVIDPEGEKPLSGLKIAIEAGHGGSSTGAIGLSGLPEKDINSDLSFRLGELCRQMGAEVIQVRDTDIDMSLLEKRDIAISSGADMLVSIHANAGGRGYLSVDGTSTYWHNPFWAPLAQAIYDRLLELDLDEFGVVGSFNYTVTRMSQMPAVLVEQAFLSHAEDEEKLADPDFRQQMAEKICQGIIDYLGL